MLLLPRERQRTKLHRTKRSKDQEGARLTKNRTITKINGLQKHKATYFWNRPNMSLYSQQMPAISDRSSLSIAAEGKLGRDLSDLASFWTHCNYTSTSQISSTTWKHSHHIKMATTCTQQAPNALESESMAYLHSLRTYRQTSPFEEFGLCLAKIKKWAATITTFILSK